MKKPFRITYFLLILLAVIAIGVFLFSQIKPVYKNFYDAIPKSSIAIIESNNTKGLWNKINSGNGFWNDLTVYPTIGGVDDKLKLMDTLIGDNPSLRNALRDKQLAMVLHEISDDIGIILIIETLGELRFGEVENLINNSPGQRFTLEKHKHKQYLVGKIFDQVDQTEFWFSILNGLFIGSYNRLLLELSLEQTESEDNLLHDASFKRLRETSGRSVDGYIFAHGSRVAKLIRSGSAQAYKELAFDAFENFSGWSSLDLILKPNEILLNGYTDIDNLDLDYLAAIIGHHPVQPRLLNILPFNTNVLIHFGMDDYARYYDSMINQTELEELNNKYSFNFRNKLVEHIDEEVVFAVAGGKPTDGAFFAAKVKNQQQVEQSLRQLATLSVNNQRAVQVENITILHINLKGIIPQVFGPVFKEVDGFWYSLFDNYLLVSNNVQTLEDIIRLYRSGRTLDLNENFNSFANNLSYQSNIFFYLNLRESSEILNQYLDEQFMGQINQKPEAIRNFEGLAVQFSHISGLIYTNIYLKYNPGYKEERLIEWRTKLDAAIAGKPSIIEDHVTAKYNVIVFDAENNMYLISPDGDIYWKRKLNEEPVSEVFAVDFYKNGRIQYLFNTPNYLYLIDRNGENVANYPVRLRSQATNGISVFDYSNNRDYRILVNGADKTTYNYDIRGREVDGWQKPRTQGIVTKPVERLVADGRDYIIITDIEGNIRIVDRRGRTRINPSGKIDKALHSNFYVNRTNSRGIILTTNSEGQLLYVATNGTLSTTDFGSFSPQHFFLYEDYNQNNSIDFIYLDDNKLTIFDRFRNVLFEKVFANSIITKPVFFNVTRSKRLLGIVSEASKEIFLIDKDGYMITSSGLVGETPFAVGSLHNDHEINLITGVGDILYNYVIF